MTAVSFTLDEIAAFEADGTWTALEAAAWREEANKESQLDVQRIPEAGADVPWREWVPQYYLKRDCGPFAPFHEKLWDWFDALELDEKSPSALVPWSRGLGKCLDGDTEILKSDGTRTTIRKIKVGDCIQSYNEATGEIGKDRICRKFDPKMAECIEIRTRTSKSVTLTLEHRVLTFAGWKKAGDLTLNDRIASPRHTRTESSSVHSDAEVKFLAYMLAEGGTSRASGTRWTNADSEVIEDFENCVTELGFSMKPSGKYGWYVKGAAEWVRKTGLRGSYAKTKRIPGWVFQLPSEQIWKFLSAFIDTDGWITPQGQICIGLANEPLILDLVYLFASVGVICNTYFKHNLYDGAWTLYVDAQNIKLCADNLSLVLKADKLANAAQLPRYSLTDTYPSIVCTNLGRGVNRLIRRLGGPNLGPNAYEDVTRNKIQAALAHVEVEHLRKLENNDVFWDKVVSITDVGLREVFDVEVEGNHNLITNLLVTHNSTSLEGGIIRTCVKGTRRFWLYVSRTLEDANNHVTAIARVLEKMGIDRQVNKYGLAVGWNAQKLRTASGFSILSFGLDAGARGIKLDDVRPDGIALDDIDHLGDSMDMIEKKCRTITNTIMQAGSPSFAAIFVQNPIGPQTVMSRVRDGRLAVMADRDVALSELIPAIYDFEYEPYYITDPDGTVREVARITGGHSSWEGKSIEDWQYQIDKGTIDGFLIECQHQINIGSSFFKGFNPELHIVVPPHTPKGIDGPVPPAWFKFFGGFDWGYSDPSFFTLEATDETGRVHALESWEEDHLTNDQYADKVCATLARWGIPKNKCPIYADASMWNQETDNGAKLEAKVEAFYRAGLKFVKTDHGANANHFRNNAIVSFLALPGKFIIYRGFNQRLVECLQSAQPDKRDREQIFHNEYSHGIYALGCSMASRPKPSNEPPKTLTFEEEDAKRQAEYQASLREAAEAELKKRNKRLGLVPKREDGKEVRNDDGTLQWTQDRMARRR